MGRQQTEMPIHAPAISEGFKLLQTGVVDQRQFACEHKTSNSL